MRPGLRRAGVALTFHPHVSTARDQKIAIQADFKGGIFVQDQVVARLEGRVGGIGRTSACALGRAFLAGGTFAFGRASAGTHHDGFSDFLFRHSLAADFSFFGFAFCGYGAFRLTRTLTGSYTAAWAAGVVFAFIPYRFHVLSQITYVFAGWISIGEDIPLEQVILQRLKNSM